MVSTQLNTFIDKFHISIDEKKLIKLSLSGKRNKDSELKKIIVTAVDLKKGYCLNFVYRYNTKDITKNHEIVEGIEIIAEMLVNEFLIAELSTTTENIQLNFLPNGKAKLKIIDFKVQIKPDFTHDKNKKRLIIPNENIYLRELEVLNANFEIRREMSDKYKQINQYIELLAPVLSELKLPDNYHVVDMGSGKGYLTFALYDYLTNQLKQTITMTGVEYREDLVNTCSAIAKKANFNKLQFMKGSIVETKLDKIDILIALHACDTATDDAIFRGIQSNAALIVCAPCCHKQIRKAMKVPNELANITRFGILKERQAEIITDTIRAMILEAFGYKTNVFEFISLEHTPKNVMIVGRKTNPIGRNKTEILNEIASIKQLFGINKHYLETLLDI